jgi:hypothetical protein
MNLGKPRLTVKLLIKEAEEFCVSMSRARHESIAGVTDGKAVGTYIEAASVLTCDKATRTGQWSGEDI